MNATPERIAQLRQQVEAIRDLTRKRIMGGATGLQVAAAISQGTDEFLSVLIGEALEESPPKVRQALFRSSAMVAVGGSGRGDPAPYSDVDLLFVSRRSMPAEFHPFVSRIVRDSWDAGLKLGHSVRTADDTLRTARQDPQFATSLVDVRCLWGDADFVADLIRKFHRRTVQRRPRQFIEDCILAREVERAQHGAAVLQLEPDIKRSFGGLRDLHLLRWVGFARYGVSDIDSLKLLGALTLEDARRLVLAHDYLTSVRINLHLSAGRPHDLLSRDDQLRIADERRFPGTAGQLPVERFMQEYFAHSLAIADISSRFVIRHRQHPLLRRVIDFVLSYRVDDIYIVGPQTVSVVARHRESIGRSIEKVLQLYLTASKHKVLPEPTLVESIKQHLSELPEEPLSPEAAQLFLELLKRPGQLSALLRSLFDAGVLERVLPAMKHTRCLLQFNQYHSYTVDEHTFRAVGAAEAFEHDSGPVGRAYREIHHKELLHLALLLHDAGKGYEEDHSEVGKRLAEEAAVRLGIPEHQRDLLVFLVHRHLRMATLAFRRDISDTELLLNFSHEVGSPDALQMLYVLTAADITAVGPGVWNDWKAELLTILYDRAMIWLSGKSHLFAEQVRLQDVVDEVLRCARLNAEAELAVRERLQHAPPHYLFAARPERIAQDLAVIQRRRDDDIEVEANYDAETRTMEYRVITSESVGVGFFHKLTGVLSAKRMEILNAQICTYSDGIIIDSFRVHDHDHDGPVPEFRRREVAGLLEQALRGAIDVDTLFRARLRFAPNIVQGPVSNLPLRAVIDNETSDRCTVIDIFAHDRPGLLYRIARTLFELDLSVVLAKISTHFDQVVDVFYVTDAKGRKISDGFRLRTIKHVLSEQIQQFETTLNEPASALG